MGERKAKRRHTPDMRAIAPGLDGRFVGAAYCPAEGQGDPLRGTLALLALARRAGVRFGAGLDVMGLARVGTGWEVRTSAGTLRADQVVNAAGVGCARVGALAGVCVPSYALVQQVVALVTSQPRAHPPDVAEIEPEVAADDP